MLCTKIMENLVKKKKKVEGGKTTLPKLSKAVASRRLTVEVSLLSDLGHTAQYDSAGLYFK